VVVGVGLGCGVRRGRRRRRYLVEHGLAWAEEAGATEVFLEVSVQNLKAIRLYERVGFTRIDQRLDYYGPGDDALVMRWQPASGTGVSDV
ncbi:MAG: GNAT family N-acetyltransferase, partial [Propionibacteriaceae bacterium]|jgi:ribosomal protein S18 acetylase RimI-like enzyme|nr:GNAT family N-acetyltransferase [Propionibacteriaceae bacterium]